MYHEVNASIDTILVYERELGLYIVGIYLWDSCQYLLNKSHLKVYRVLHLVLVVFYPLLPLVFTLAIVHFLEGRSLPHCKLTCRAHFYQVPAEPYGAWPLSYPTDFVFSGACRANFEEEFIGGAADLSFSDSALSLHDNP